MSSIGENLRKLRLKSDLTQKELATQLGFSESTISSWERGRTEIDSSSIKQIANFFNVSLDYLYNGIDYELKSTPSNISFKSKVITNTKEISTIRIIIKVVLILSLGLLSIVNSNVYLYFFFLYVFYFIYAFITEVIHNSKNKVIINYEINEKLIYIQDDSEPKLKKDKADSIFFLTNNFLLFILTFAFVFNIISEHANSVIDSVILIILFPIGIFIYVLTMFLELSTKKNLKVVDCDNSKIYTTNIMYKAVNLLVDMFYLYSTIVLFEVKEKIVNNVMYVVCFLLIVFSLNAFYIKCFKNKNTANYNLYVTNNNKYIKVS